MADKELQLGRAKTAMLSHDYETAARIYNTLIQENPADSDLKIQLGNLYIKSGDDKNALNCFEEIKKTNGGVDTLIALGGIYRRLGRYDDSLAMLQDALATKEKSVQSLYSMGFTYRQMGRYDDAIDCFKNVINQNPRDVLAFNHLGAIYALRGDHDKAISTYQRGLKIDQNHPVLQMNLAKSFEATGDTQKALSHYEAALRSKPGWVEAIDAYSDLLLKENHVKEADDVVSRTLKINPDDVKMHTAMGKIYNRQNIYESAEEEFKKALSKNDEYTPALTGLAFSQDKQGKHTEAAETIQKAGRISPDDVSILKQTANILLSANYLPAAYEKISRLWEINQNDVETVNLLGQYYICHGDEDKIEACFDKIEQIAPSYTDVYKNWGERYMQIGDEKNAEDYLKAAVHENPADPEAKIQLAGLYEVQGKNDVALDLLSEANRLDEFNVASRARAEKIERTVSRNPSAIEMASVFDSDSSEISLGGDDEIAPTSNIPAPQIDEEEPPHIEPSEDNPFAVNLDDVIEDGSKKPSDVDFSDDKEEPEEKTPTLEEEGEFNFDAFGAEDLSGEPKDAISIDDLMEEEPELEAENDFDTLIDDDTPVDDEDDSNFPSSPIFMEEDVQSPSMLSEEIPLPTDSEEEKDDERHKARKISDEDYLSLENQIRQIKSAAESAKNTADQAWRAAQFASDYAKDVEKNVDEKIDEKINEKIGDGLNEKIDDKLSETLDNFITPPDADLLSESQSESENEAEKMLKKAIETLPSIVRAIENKEVSAEFALSLDMFKKLREMLEFLPPAKKKQFMTSRNRLMLDYIIARLSGKPGLFATITALLNSGLVSPHPTPTEEATSDITIDSENDDDVIALVSSVMGTLRTLCENLQDDYLRDAIDTEILNLLEKIRAKSVRA